MYEVTCNAEFIIPRHVAPLFSVGRAWLRATRRQSAISIAEAARREGDLASVGHILTHMRWTVGDKMVVRR
jgi:hypothetical protein